MPNPYLRAALAEQQKRRTDAAPKTPAAESAVEKAAESADKSDTKPSTKEK